MLNRVQKIATVVVASTIVARTTRALSLVPGVYAFVVNPILRRIDFSRLTSTKFKLRTGIFYFDLNDYTQRRAWFGRFEERECRFITKHLAPGDLAFDVGANIGLLAIPMARAVAPDGKVVVVEPLPENVRGLQRNLELNAIDCCQIVPHAAGNVQQTVNFTMSHSSADKSTGFFRRAEADEAGEKFEVEQIRLDGLIAEQLVAQDRVQLLKIDVEGMEHDVLDGIGRMLSPSVIQFVLFEVVVSQAGVEKRSQEVIELLKANGFEIREITRLGDLSATTLNRDRLKRTRSTTLNLVATGNRS